MFVTKTALSRRTVLRGLGTALALPFLDAMTPAFARGLPCPGERRGASDTAEGLFKRCPIALDDDGCPWRTGVA